MKDKRIGWKQLLLVLLFVITIIVLYVTHKAVPFMMDDLWYSTMLFSEEPIHSLGDILESQIWHYYNWGGRSVTHTILQLTLMSGEVVADILNVLVTVLLSGAVCVVAGVRKQNNILFYMFAVIGMLVGFNANWKMSMFWQAGAANYLYITVLLLVYIYCYLREIPKEVTICKKLWFSALEENKTNLWGIAFWIVPLGLVAGWSNENMGPAGWIISLLVILLCRYTQNRVKVWMVLGNLSCLVGSVLVVIAPGNFVRSEEAAANEYGLLWNVFLRCYAECKAALEFLFPVLLFTCFIIVIGKFIMDIPVGLKRGMLLLTALLSWGAMVLSPHYPDRATFGTMVLLICVIISYMKDILEKRKDLGVVFGAVNLFVWLRGMYFLGEFLALSWGWIR